MSDDTICCICGAANEPWPGRLNDDGKPFGYGHNPEPVRSFSDGRCCDTCNNTVVLPTRLGIMRKAHLN